MMFDKDLKKKVEPLANKYFLIKQASSGEITSEMLLLEQEIVSKIEPYAISKVRKSLSNEIREDAIQEIRLGIVKALRDFNPKKGKFCTWVIWKTKYLINRDITSDKIKVPAYIKAAISSQDQDKLSKSVIDKVNIVKNIKFVDTDLLDATEHSESNLDLLLALQSLKENAPYFYELIVLRFVDGQSVSDIAKIKKISRHKAQKVIDDGIKYLKQILGDYDG